MNHYQINLGRKITSKISDFSPKQAIFTVAIIKLTYFFIEMLTARITGSLSLYAESIDFLEDAFSGIIIAFAIVLGHKNHQLICKALSAVLVIPAVIFLLVVYGKMMDPFVPSGYAMSLTAIGSLFVNAFCLFLLRHLSVNHHALSYLMFITSKIDVIASSGIVIAGLLTSIFNTLWVDCIVGSLIFLLNVKAAKVIWSMSESKR